MYIKLNKLVKDKGILCVKDTNGDGKIDDIKKIGNYAGAGITIKYGYLHASSNDEVINQNLPEKIITGLINGRQHNTKLLALDNNLCNRICM